MELAEEVGESSSPIKGSSFIGGFVGIDIRNEVYNKLMDNGNEEALSNPEDFRDQLEAHFNRLPARYGSDVNMDRVEDVLLHQKLLARAKDQENQPVFNVRFVENVQIRPDGIDDLQPYIAVSSTSVPCINPQLEGDEPSIQRKLNNEIDFESCSKLEDLNLDVGKNAEGFERLHLMEKSCGGQKVHLVPIHEIIFSTIDKPKLLCQLSALLSDIGLNIREAHVFSTTDGFSLDVFVVDGWPFEDTDGLSEAVEKALAGSEGSLSGSSPSHSVVEKALATQLESGDGAIDGRLLTMGEKFASGSCGDLYHGAYCGTDVAVKVFEFDHQNEALPVDFAQEVMILRKVRHRNVVRFIGACAKLSRLCIVTEYMPGGSLYDFLHNHHNVLELPLLLKFAIDVCNGMEYLHQNDIIHRDLKTANLLMGTENVVKVADFGVARFQSQGGVMTAETGTYRWMAPEVLKHQQYNQKADVFSFAIVLWELTTAKIPYDEKSPLQAALGVINEGLRPDIPNNVDPRISDLMQRCWEAEPKDRPSFSEIRLELEEILQAVQGE